MDTVPDAIKNLRDLLPVGILSGCGHPPFNLTTPTKPDLLYLDLPPKSSQFGTCRSTKLDKLKNLHA